MRKLLLLVLHGEPMRKLLLLVLLVFSLALITIGALQLVQARSAPRVVIATQAPTTDVRRVSVQELAQMLEAANPPLVWEFRTADSYAQQHLPGSRLVQLEEIAGLAKSLNRDQAIVAVCS